MARIVRARHSIFTAAVLRAYRWMCVLMLPLLGAGCAPWDRPLPIPPEVSEAGVATRVSIPLDRKINPAERMTARTLKRRKTKTILTNHNDELFPPAR